MSTAYALAYRLGLTPWENAGDSGHEQLDRLFDEIEEVTGGPGRALDLGCGRGLHAVALARRGWQVTGVDAIGRAVRSAQDRARSAGVQAQFVEGDVTDLPDAVGDGYTFALDIGCFHGLPEDQRLRYGKELDRVTVPGAVMLLLAFRAGGRGPLPRGTDRQDVEAALPAWSITGQEPADTSGMPRPLRSRAPQFYRLRRS